MDESLGAQYALQVALQTLKERCQQFQQRLTVLEEENINLRIKCNQNQDNTESSLPEIDNLKQRIAQLNEQKAQLTNNVLMVANENKHLWARLSKLTQVNQTLGSKLNKIHDKLTQHNTTSTVTSTAHTPLIRSQTFTQDDLTVKLPHKNLVDESDKISLDLEDISLKLISTIAKEKCELELQCSQMIEIQNSETVLTNSIGFSYPNDDVDDNLVDEVDHHFNQLRHIKEMLLQEKGKLQKNLTNINITNLTSKCKSCSGSNNEKVTKSSQTEKCLNVESVLEEDPEVLRQLDSLTKWGTPDNSTSFVDSKPLVVTLKTPTTQTGDIERICPMCNEVFNQYIKFKDFQTHVENHFVIENDGATNFEIVP